MVCSQSGSRMKSSELEDILELHLKSYKIPYEKEVKFHPTRKWRFDFALPQNLAVEVEGATWSGGRHTRGSGFEKDTEKYANALVLGWRVLRVTGNQVRSGQAIQWVLDALGLSPTNKSSESA